MLVEVARLTLALISFAIGSGPQKKTGMRKRISGNCRSEDCGVESRRDPYR